MTLAYYRIKPLITSIVVIVPIATVTLSALFDCFQSPTPPWWCWLIPPVGPTAIVLLLLSIHNQYLWKYRPFRCLVTIPNLNGNYRGDIEYTWNETPQSKKCEMVIQQTASHIKVKCSFFKEGENGTRSESKEAILTRDEQGNHSLFFRYTNKGSGTSGDPLDQHDGFTSLEVKRPGGDAITLEGEYFTSRTPYPTKGLMKVTKVNDGNITL